MRNRQAGARTGRAWNRIPLLLLLPGLVMAAPDGADAQTCTGLPTFGRPTRVAAEAAYHPDASMVRLRMSRDVGSDLSLVAELAHLRDRRPSVFAYPSTVSTSGEVVGLTVAYRLDALDLPGCVLWTGRYSRASGTYSIDFPEPQVSERSASGPIGLAGIGAAPEFRWGSGGFVALQLGGQLGLGDSRVRGRCPGCRGTEKEAFLTGVLETALLVGRAPFFASAGVRGMWGMNGPMMISPTDEAASIGQLSIGAGLAF
jgi:hypothetical protein